MLALLSLKLRSEKSKSQRAAPGCQLGQDMQHALGKSWAHLAAQSQTSAPGESQFLVLLRRHQHAK